MQKCKSLILEILEELWNTELYYKGMRVNLLGIPRFNSYKNGYFRGSIWRLKKKELIKKDSTGFYITPQGKKYLEKKTDSLKQFKNQFSKDSKKDLLVMFDIPENKKPEREWFRWHLKKFNYVMVQKSVWIGPSPLPSDFIAYLKEIKIDKTFKTFKLAKHYRLQTQR